MALPQWVRAVSRPDPGVLGPPVRSAMAKEAAMIGTGQRLPRGFHDTFTGFLRGCPGLQAGEESDSCGAGQG
jgi:hypothetical protein